MAQCFRTALAAQALDKSFQPFASKEVYEDAMHKMVSKDQIKRLGQGWMEWAATQAAEWENMIDSQTHDQHIQSQKMLGPPVEVQEWVRQMIGTQ